MTQDGCAPFLENIPAFALGALEPLDAAALKKHVLICPRCRDELDEYRALADTLLTAASPVPPPPALRHGLQARLPSARADYRQRVWPFSFGRLAVGAALLFLLGLNIYSMIQIQALKRSQALLAQQINTGQTALAMMSYPDVRTVPINDAGIAGTVLIDSDRNLAVLVAWSLPDLPPEKIYQVWLIDPNGSRTSAGLFRPAAGQPFSTEVIHAGQSLSSYSALGVTIEPGGGSAQPTGPRVFKVDF